MKNKFVYNVDMDNKKIAKLSISKNLSTKEIGNIFTRILSDIRKARYENDMSTELEFDKFYKDIEMENDTLEVPKVETRKEWR